MAVDALHLAMPLPTGVREVTGRAMGSDVHVLVVGGPSGLPALAATRLADLEARWSRFRATSELSRLSASPGRAVVVSSETWRLVVSSVDAWRRTGGRCDASVLPAVVAAGYDRDLEALPVDRPDLDTVHAPRAPSPGLGGVVLHATDSTVGLPPGVALDPGALGKGLAADLVVAELLGAGARGALVNVGGDLVVSGEPVEGDAWTVELQLAAGPSARWTLAEGAVATSSTRRRHWRVGGDRRHHVIDPATARPVDDPPATVSTVTGDGWWAEASATAITVGGTAWARSWAPDNGVTGLVEELDGSRHALPGAGGYLS